MLNAGNAGSSYLWSSGETTSTLSITASGNYSVTVTSPQNCTATDNIIIMIRSNPTVFLGNDTLICANEFLLLDAGNPGATYHWNTSSNQQSIHPNVTGDYVVTVTNIYQCYDIDTIHVIVKQLGSLSGTAVYSGGTIGANKAKVLLYVSGTLESGNVYKETTIGNSGTFLFSNVNPGNYLVYIQLNNDSDYQYVENSYYDTTYKWQNAQVVSLQCEQSKTITLIMYESLQSAPGIHTLTGQINYFDPGKEKSMGEPVPGAEIYVEMQPNNNLLANTEADTTGFWYVTAIPDGVVSIYVDIPGIPMTSAYVVTLSPTTINYGDLNYLVDTISGNNSIFKNPENSINQLNSTGFLAEVYPNPFHEFIDISYSLSAESFVNIQLIDVFGRVISIIDKSNKSEGKYSNRISSKKLELSSGTYFLKMQVNNSVYLKKIVLTN